MNDMSYNVYFRTAGMIAPALLFIYPGMLPRSLLPAPLV
jgi:hypothetical protein